MRVVSNVHVDAMGVRAPGPPESHGFSWDARVWRRLGWRAVERRDAHGVPSTHATAEDVHAGVDTSWCEGLPLTRLDLCRDVVHAPLSPGLLHFLAGHRGRVAFLASRTGCTVYCGSRRSPLMLRVYGPKVATPWLASRWQQYEDYDGSPVTRVEFEFHARALAGAVVGVERQVESVQRLWADGLARIRLCGRPADSRAQRNQVETAQAWRLLGAPCKQMRARAAVGAVKSVDELVARLVRIVERTGLTMAEVVDAVDRCALK